MEHNSQSKSIDDPIFSASENRKSYIIRKWLNPTVLRPNICVNFELPALTDHGHQKNSLNNCVSSERENIFINIFLGLKPLKNSILTCDVLEISKKHDRKLKNK